MEPEIHLRPSQRKILRYTAGKMGISAVPGSGKTWTLSLLAAQIIQKANLADDQEVLIVTLVNSAVDNFYQKVSDFIEKNHLVPNLGYRVRTLHGLAHDIVRERPEFAGLDNNFQIIDEKEAGSILQDVTQAWLHNHPDWFAAYLKTDLDEHKRLWVLKEQVPVFVKDIAQNFIRYAKDNKTTPQLLQELLSRLPVPLSLAEMGSAIYADYQRVLSYRGAVDFDDLVRLALLVLETDPQLLERLRLRWPFILEDEAQDSNRLQEEILSLLCGSGGNWVRVGDPNQAIYETFTTANPRYLLDFIHSPNVLSQELPNSGRSSQSIITLANYLVEWSMSAHPVAEVRGALQAPPLIKTVPPDDPQPNPADQPQGLQLIRRKLTPQEEIQAVANSLAEWLPGHQDQTVAVLVPRNLRAFDLVDELRRRQVPYVDSLLRSSTSTRQSAGVLGNILKYLADPQSASKLTTAFKVWRRADRQDEEAQQRVDKAAELIKKCFQVEDYISPDPGKDWLAALSTLETDQTLLELLSSFRLLVLRWQGSVLLPIDQVILTLSQDLFSEPTELALAHKLAVLLRRASQQNPTWRLPELTEELVVIARNQRRFLGFSDDDTGFDPEKHRGKVVISTMHKAKGLEWNRVYLMSVNNYDFPSGLAADTYISEKWFVRDQLNLEAEALAQFDQLFSNDPYTWLEEGRATQNARIDYIRERLRLFYVGITRARQELIVTWNTGRQGKAQPALPLVALMSFWEDHLAHLDHLSDTRVKE
jgi:DNA helicase II / ATP-dependent DNA helicase PcrA